MARFSDWDYFNKNVQSGLTEGQFINSAGCLLCAGPPFLAITSGGTEDQLTASDIVYPIGLVSNWAISQQLAVVPVPEAGSYRRYTITGPSDGALQLTRTMYHGPSLLRVLYAYYKADTERRYRGTPIEPLIDSEAANIARNPKNVIWDTPGYENAWFNLSSDLLSQPVGILLYIQDVNRESYGAVYLEQAQVGNHNMGGGPSQLVVAESVSMSFARARPVRLANPIPLFSRFADSGVITSAGTMTGGEKKIAAVTQSNR